MNRPFNLYGVMSKINIQNQVVTWTAFYVVVIPFSHELGEKTEIVNSDETAQIYLQKVMDQKHQIMNKGTNIEIALVAAFKKVAQSYSDAGMIQKKGEALDFRKANIWLLTDGGSTISEANLIRARIGIPEDVEVNVQVVFVGEKNDNLVTFLTETEKKRNKNGLGRLNFEFMSDRMISETLKKPIALSAFENAFATDKKLLELGGGLLEDLRGVGPQFKSKFSQKSQNGQVDLNEDSVNREINQLFQNISWDDKISAKDVVRNIELEYFLEMLINKKKELIHQGIYKNIMISLHHKLMRNNLLKKLNVIEFGLIQDLLIR
jgi:hypothetical protein